MRAVAPGSPSGKTGRLQPRDQALAGGRLGCRQYEPGPQPSIGKVIHIHAAAVQFGDFFCEIKPEARALLSRLGTFQRKELFENARPREIGNARTFVVDAQLEPVAFWVADYGNASSFRAEVDGILHQI